MKRIVGYSIPVAHDQSVKPPFSTKHILDQPWVLAGVCTVDPVVSGHVAVRFRVLLCNHERHQVDFSKRSFRQDAVDGLSLVFLVVANIMLDGSSDTGRLNAVNGRCTHSTGKVRIFAEALESSTS